MLLKKVHWTMFDNKEHNTNNTCLIKSLPLCGSFELINNLISQDLIPFVGTPMTTPLRLVCPAEFQWNINRILMLLHDFSKILKTFFIQTIDIIYENKHKNSIGLLEELSDNKGDKKLGSKQPFEDVSIQFD